MFYTSLPQSEKEHLCTLSKRGVRAIFSAPPWTHTEPLLREMKLCSIDLRYTPIDALVSSLLCQKYKLRSPSNSTHSTTRSQLTLSLCIPSAARRPGTISPLFTSTLLWNSLPSPTLDQLLLCTLSGKICRNISQSLLLGHDRPFGFPKKTTTMKTFFVFVCLFFNWLFYTEVFVSSALESFSRLFSSVLPSVFSVPLPPSISLPPLPLYFLSYTLSLSFSPCTRSLTPFLYPFIHSCLSLSLFLSLSRVCVTNISIFGHLPCSILHTHIAVSLG